MEVLKHQPGEFAIVADGDFAAVVVICGTSALFEVWVKQTRAKAIALLANGPALQALIERTRLDPGKA